MQQTIYSKGTRPTIQALARTIFEEDDVFSLKAKGFHYSGKALLVVVEDEKPAYKPGRTYKTPSHFKAFCHKLEEFFFDAEFTNSNGKTIHVQFPIREESDFEVLKRLEGLVNARYSLDADFEALESQLDESSISKMVENRKQQFKTYELINSADNLINYFAVEIDPINPISCFKEWMKACLENNELIGLWSKDLNIHLNKEQLCVD